MNQTLPKTERIRQALDRAELALRAYAPQEALEHADTALHLDPSQPEARLIEARAHMLTRQPRETLRALDAHDQYGQLDADDPRLDTALLRTASLAQLGKTALAIGLLETVTDLAPRDLGVLRSLAALQIKDGRKAEAIETLTVITDSDPKDRVSARALSGLLAAHAPSRAVDALGKIGGDDRLRAARLCREAGRWRDAERYYDALLRGRNDHAWLWLEAGTLAMEMGELIRAEERLQQAVACARGPKGNRKVRREAWSALAVQWMRRGRALRAGRAWWLAVRSDDSPYARGWAGLLTCTTRAGRENLMREADRMLRDQTTRAERRAMVAAQWLELVPDAYAEAAAAADRTIPVAEVSPLGKMIGEALETLRDASQRHAGRADVRYHHAVMLDANRQTDEAVEEATAALAINPAYRSAQAICARLAA